MKKDGFVFMESIVVLVVVALSIATLISSYSLVSRISKEKENYDKVSDKYLLYTLSKLGTDSRCNYGISCPSLTFTGVSFRADKDNTSEFFCEGTKVGEILIDCAKVFEDMHLVHLYVVDNVRNELNDLHADGTKKNNPSEKAARIYDNGTIEYMKTLKKCNTENTIDANGQYVNNNKIDTRCNDPIIYLIGVFERGNKEYNYASIVL